MELPSELFFRGCLDGSEDLNFLFRVRAEDIPTMDPAESVSSNSEFPLMTLPNELLFEVASYLDGFKDFNSLIRATLFFRTLFNPLLYHRAVASDDTVREEIVEWVIRQYRVTSLRLLLENGLSIHQELRRILQSNNSMLDFVLNLQDEESSVPMVRLLIERGASLEAKDPQHLGTVLHIAVSQGTCGISEVLLEHGADVTATDKYGRTALHLASSALYLASSQKRDDARMVNLLLVYGAAVDARTANGDTPLLLTNWINYRAVIPAILAHGADAGARDNNGVTPLHWAIMFYSPQRTLFMVKFLLENGADINAISKNGRSPLLFTTAPTPDVGGRLFVFLVRNGADLSVLERAERGTWGLAKA